MFERGVCGFAVGSALRGLLERAGAERCVGADLCAVPRTVASLAPSACHVDTRLRLASGAVESKAAESADAVDEASASTKDTLCGWEAKERTEGVADAVQRHFDRVS